MKSSADVGAHRVVPIDVAEIDHLLFEIDCVAGQRLFRRVNLDLAQRARLRLEATTGEQDWSSPIRWARSRGRRKTAGCRPRDSRAYSRWRRWRRSPFGARTAIAPSASRLRRDRSMTIARHSWDRDWIEPCATGLARGLPRSGTSGSLQPRGLEGVGKAFGLGEIVQPLLLEKNVQDFDPRAALADREPEEGADGGVAELHVDLDGRRRVPGRLETRRQSVAQRSALEEELGRRIDEVGEIRRLVVLDHRHQLRRVGQP